GVLGIEALALARQALGTPPGAEGVIGSLLGPGPVRFLGLVTVLAALVTSLLEPGFERLLAGGPEGQRKLRTSLGLPPLLLGLVPLVVGIGGLGSGVSHSAMNVLLGALAV